jgi:hypothetical protein
VVTDCVLALVNVTVAVLVLEANIALRVVVVLAAVGNLFVTIQEVILWQRSRAAWPSL